MTTMSDDGERTCPLCAEEMDLTDQQLKPCKCGYEICVWCWHHINEMAEKEDSKGRCPACRTPYDKERIVGMAANCERVLAETNADRKQKPQKAKVKPSAEARKQLSSVRVIQRNLVYIIGLPSNLANESMLEHREYFGQYGKILKVSISRPAATPGATNTPQALNGNTFSVYITYAREEEAVRCIQAVHNFILEGKPLRACFGTTKYCHTWLRNMTCSNPDCLYLHDIGSQEDSFTKDEIISAYTRSRVPQFASNNLQRRAGNALPPPVDDFYNNSAVSTKPVLKGATTVKSSNGSGGGKSTVLPASASWGLHVSSSRPTASVAYLQSPVKAKTDILSTSSTFSSIVSNTKQTSAWHDEAAAQSKIGEGRHMLHMDVRSRPLETPNSGIIKEDQITVSNALPEAVQEAIHTHVSAWDDDDDATVSIPEARHTFPVNKSSRLVESPRPTDVNDNPISVLDESTQIILDDEISEWNDDSTPSSVPEPSPMVHIGGRAGPSENLSHGMPGDYLTAVSDISTSAATDAAHNSSSPPATSPEDDGHIPVPRENGMILEGLGIQPIDMCPDNDNRISKPVNGDTESLCSMLSSVNLDSRLGVDHTSNGEDLSSSSNYCVPHMLRDLDTRLQQRYPDQGVERLTSLPLGKSSLMADAYFLGELSDWRAELQKPNSSSTNGLENTLSPADDHIHRLPNVINHPLKISNHSISGSQNFDVGYTQFPVNGNSGTSDKQVEQRFYSLKDNESVHINGHRQEMPSSSAEYERVFQCPDITYTETELKFLGMLDDVSHPSQTTNVDIRKGSSTLDTLSFDFDPWNDSLSSANNFAKLLSEMDKRDGSSKLSSSWKLQNGDQSRFSFARQENQASSLNASRRDIGHSLFSSSEDAYGDRFQSGFPTNSFEVPNAFVSNGSVISSDRTSGTARSNISAPPGFSIPNRAPPPGFSQNKFDQAYDMSTEHHILGSSFQNQLQVHPGGNAGDVEFIDPAILAVGKGRLPLGISNPSSGLRSAFPSELNPSDGDTRLQLLMQQSMSAHQEPRISDHIGDRFLHYNSAYISSNLSSQSPNNISPFAQISHPQPQISQQQPSHILNGQWNGWNDVRTLNGMGMSEMMRNDRFGLNNYFPVNGEHKFHIPSSGNLYSRAFGM